MGKFDAELKTGGLVFMFFLSLLAYTLLNQWLELLLYKSHVKQMFWFMNYEDLVYENSQRFKLTSAYRIVSDFSVFVFAFVSIVACCRVDRIVYLSLILGWYVLEFITFINLMFYIGFLYLEAQDPSYDPQPLLNFVGYAGIVFAVYKILHVFVSLDKTSKADYSISHRLFINFLVLKEKIKDNNTKKSILNSYFKTSKL